jgi:hypothetical protein
MNDPRITRTRPHGAAAELPLDIHAEDGVTLVEAVLALTILSVGLLSLFALHHAAITASQLSFRTSEATYLAQDMMDELLAKEYTRDQTHESGYFQGTTDLTDSDNPFMEYDHAFNAAPVGCLGSVGGGDGLPMYTRTYDVQHLSAGTDDYGRMILRTRVSFRMKETGKQHGVTLISTRSWDRYEN